MRTAVIFTVLLAAVLWLTACGSKSTSTNHAAAKASAQAAASAAATNPAVITAEANLGKCFGKATSPATSGGHPYRTFKACVHSYFPPGTGHAVYACAIGVYVTTYVTHHGSAAQVEAGLTACATKARL